MTKIGMVLADIHFGASDPKRLYEELEELVLDKIDNLPILDFIVLAGDIFHFKVYLNSGASKYCTKFIKELLNRTKKHNTDIVILEGTSSHDNKQMVYITEFIQDPRLRMYTEVNEITLCDDIKVLCIPEEYIVDQDAYYKEYFDRKYYDMIIGHGMVDKMWYSNKSANEDIVTRVPVFKVNDLLDHCTNCYFGHIHTQRSYGDSDRFKYISSFTRWQFGEEEDKGYWLVTINTKTREIHDEFIVNHMAPRMMTCMVDLRGSISLDDVRDMIDHEMSIQENRGADLIRLIVNIDKSMDNFMMIKEFVMNTYGSIKRVKLVLGIDIPQDAMCDMKESMVNKQLMNDYVFDKNMSIEDKISLFIQEKQGKYIDPVEVRQYLNESL